MRIGQKVNVIAQPFDVKMGDFIVDDGVQTINLRPSPGIEKGPVVRCDARLRLSIMGDKSEWDGQEPGEVVQGCTTGILLLTNLSPEKMMSLMHHMMHSLFPGGDIKE